MTTSPTVPQLRLASKRLASGPLVHYAEQGDPSGQALLFIHGWPDSWYSWSRVLQFLPATYQAYAFDQRGFGDSERPDDGYTIDHFVADAVAFLDAVGLARVTLVGHSFGSFVARRVAEVHPERVAGLVLIGSALTPDNEVTREVLEVAQSLEEGLVPLEFVREFQASTLHISVPEAFFEGLVAESRKAPARVWRSSFDNLLTFDDADQLGSITAPSLIIWGDHDGLFPLEQQERLAATIPGAQLTIYPESGHSPNWERPERLAADLQTFLASI
jgi:non-heme chloroperoxidase